MIPKSGKRFSDKILRKQNHCGQTVIQLDPIVL